MKNKHTACASTKPWPPTHQEHKEHPDVAAHNNRTQQYGKQRRHNAFNRVAVLKDKRVEARMR